MRIMLNMQPVYTYRGAIHVHSKHSDGRGSVQQIAADARRVGVDFVIITDHNTIAARDDGPEGWHGKALILVSEEVTPDTNADHYLALGARGLVQPSSDPGENISAVRAAGGLGIVAHPTGGAVIHGEYVEYPWTNWNAGVVDGIEIWNHVYDITGKSRNLLQMILWAIAPCLAPAGPIDSVLELWDHLVAGKGRPTVAIGGTDCHGILSSYPRGLRSVCTYIVCPSPFSGDLKHDSELVYSAIREGRCYVGGDKIKDAAGFCCYVNSGDRTVHMGGTVRLSRGAVLMVRSPAEGEIRIVRNGECVLKWRGSELEAELKARGAYRVEVAIPGRKREKPWIYGNHIWVI